MQLPNIVCFTTPFLEMIIWEFQGKPYRFACNKCQSGHRNARCEHLVGRELLEINPKGRPITQCEHCRERRKQVRGQTHNKCLCGDSQISKRKKVQLICTSNVILTFSVDNFELLKLHLDSNRDIFLKVNNNKSDEELPASSTETETQTTVPSKKSLV
ncbi:hypothetical protein HK096_011301, partial [Nowakowskiella sp. JEL0078]